VIERNDRLKGAWSQDVPVVFVLFNRPELARKVFDVLRVAQPRILYVVADGPREGHADDAGLCSETLKILDTVDWPCRIVRDIADTNMGCQKRVSSGVSRALSEFERCIVLEDDCVPDPSFFPFCSELLERYERDERIMAVSGDNFVNSQTRSNTYYFSRFNHIWGWATWRRAWNLFDFEMKDWPAYKQARTLYEIWPDGRSARYWERLFDATHDGLINSWGYRWTFCCWRNNGLTALPDVNLVTNIGFGAGATHTKQRKSAWAVRPVGSMAFPLHHPSVIEPNRAADLRTQTRYFSPPIWRRALDLLGRGVR
jgi:hypothetical protein